MPPGNRAIENVSNRLKELFMFNSTTTKSIKAAHKSFVLKNMLPNIKN